MQPFGNSIFLTRPPVEYSDGVVLTSSATFEDLWPSINHNLRSTAPSEKCLTIRGESLTSPAATHSRTEIAVRDVKTTIDEPTEREGTNMGPTPTETMVAALIACTNVISHKCAKKHGVELKAMTIDAESTLDRRGTQLLEEIEVPFPKIRLLIDVTTDANEAAMEKVKGDLRRFCPISKVIRNSGTELEEVWKVTRP